MQRQINDNRIQRGGGLHELDAKPMFSLGDVFSILFSWRYFILIVTLIAAIASIAAVSVRKRSYEAEVSIFIDPRGINVIERGLTPRGQSTDGNIAIVESQMRILQSYTILQEVVEHENLQSDPEFNGRSTNPLSAFKAIFTGGRGVSEREIMALHNLKNAIWVSRPKLSYVVELSVRSEDPEKAARLANIIAEVFLQSGVTGRSDVAQKAADSLRSRLDDLRTQLSDSENAVERYKLENNILSSTGGLINEQELSQVNEALVKARNRTSAAKVILEEVRKLKASGKLPQTLPGGIQSNTISNLRAQLSVASQRKISLSAQYLGTHPVMKAAELSLRDIRQSIFEELDRIASTAQLQYSSALGQEKELQAKVTNLSNRTYSTNDAKVKLRELQRDADSKRVVYEAFLVRAKELGGQVGIDTDDARVISPASAPIEPTGLPSVILLVVGSGAGFGFGSVLSLLFAAFSSRGVVYKSKPKTRQPIPAADGSGNLIGRMFSSSSRSVGAGIAQNSDASALKLPILLNLPLSRNHMVQDHVPILVKINNHGQRSDGISRIAQSICAARAGKRTRTILVTGFEDSFGKSTFACNLGFAAAMAGESVLTISADTASASAVRSFSNSAALELDDAMGYKIAVGQGYSVGSGANGYQLWPLQTARNVGRFHWMAQLKKLQQRFSEHRNAAGLAIIDSPLLDSGENIDELLEMSDEVIIVLPESGDPDPERYKMLTTLGEKRSRIRGVVAVSYAI